MNVWKETSEYYTVETDFTKRDIEFIESELDISIPVNYLNVLQDQNGGLLVCDSLKVDFENSWADDHLPFNNLYGISKDSTVNDTKNTLSEWGITGKNLLIGGDGTYIYFLNFDYADTAPTVCYLDISTGDSKEVAESFDELISNLYVQDDFETFDFDGGTNPRTDTNFRDLVMSKDQEEVISGFIHWIGVDGPTKEVIEEMTRQLKNSSDPSMTMFLAEQLTQFIVNEEALTYLEPKDVMLIFESKNDDNLQVYIEMIKESNN